MGKAKSAFKDYLKRGGLPKVWATSEGKIISLVKTIFYGDLMERHEIRNVNEFREVFYLLISNYRAH